MPIPQAETTRSITPAELARRLTDRISQEDVDAYRELDDTGRKEVDADLEKLIPEHDEFLQFQAQLGLYAQMLGSQLRDSPQLASGENATSQVVTPAANVVNARAK